MGSRGFSIQHHDWQSAEYVAEWIASDATRDEERRPILHRMVADTPFDKDAPIRVLDVGGGYGVVTEEALKVYPHAKVVLQDYSAPMLERARERLRPYAGQVDYVLCDLRDPAWTDRVAGPFDLAVSALALHNLRDPALIAACYRGISGLLVPGGVFVNCDRFDRVGGVEENLRSLRDAGFIEAKCTMHESGSVTLSARIKKACSPPGQ